MHNIILNNHEIVSTIEIFNNFCFLPFKLNLRFILLLILNLLLSALNPSKYPFIGHIIIAEIVETLYANVYLSAKIFIQSNISLKSTILFSNRLISAQ
jgi:hypothetical protein